VTVHVGQSALKAVVVIGEAFMIQSHEMKDGGIEIVYRGAAGNRLEAKLITFAMAEGFLNAGPGKEAGKGIGVVITPGSISLQKRHATKLCAPDDQCLIKQTATLHIMDQGSGGLVHDLRLHGVGL